MIWPIDSWQNFPMLNFRWVIKCSKMLAGTIKQSPATSANSSKKWNKKKKNNQKPSWRCSKKCPTSLTLRRWRWDLSNATGILNKWFSNTKDKLRWTLSSLIVLTRAISILAFLSTRQIKGIQACPSLSILWESSHSPETQLTTSIETHKRESVSLTWCFLIQSELWAWRFSQSPTSWRMVLWPNTERSTSTKIHKWNGNDSL